MRASWRERLQQALGGKGTSDGAGPEPASGRRGQVRVLESAEVAVASIAENPRQPRQSPDQEALAELAASIAEHGVLQPVLVRRSSRGYELVAGHRRLRAAEMAGLQMIPAVIVDVSDEDSGLLSLVENLQREELGYLEEAAAYERILKEFGLTQEELARRLGKSQSTIANKLRLLRLPETLRARLAGAVSERHARALLVLKTPRKQEQVVDAILARGLTVRQTEQLVERLRAEEIAGGTGHPARAGQSWRGVFRDVRILSNTFRAAVARLQQSGVPAELEEVEHPEALEIRVRINLPAGWQKAGAGDRSARSVRTKSRGTARTGRPKRPQE